MTKYNRGYEAYQNRINNINAVQLTADYKMKDLYGNKQLSEVYDSGVSNNWTINFVG